MNWTNDCAYSPERKSVFHAQARKRLKQLANALDLDPNTYDLRSNHGGIAVSGEITLHHERLYVQVSQPGAGVPGILYRSCQGRKDYRGGHNHFAPLDRLDDPEALAALIRRTLPNLKL
ncbi:MAG: hypothetical protein NW215_00540 [Hyphomicrobiales bacterium]|nr:hypothetical protein [Hyphomicrobiales bacterium]